MRYLAALILLIPTLAFSAVKTISLPPGTYTYGPFNLNNAIKSVSLEIDRSQWTAPAIKLSIQTTFAGTFSGPNWTCKATAQGEPITVPAKPNTRLNCTVPPGTSRTATVTVIVTGGTLTIGVDPSFSTRE